MTGNWKEDAERIRQARPRHVLFVCVANSSRSQLAAAIARALASPIVKISCAGIRPVAIHPLAVEVLADLGFDVRGTPSRRLDEIPPDDVDVVVTLCDEDLGRRFPGRALKVHWPLPDPTHATGTEEERLEVFRNVRDELTRRLAVIFGGPHGVSLGAA